MKARKPWQKRSSVRREWQTVYAPSGQTCVAGCAIPHGAKMLVSWAGWLKTIRCERHALEIGHQPPNSSFGLHSGAGEDVRARQAGSD